MQILVIGGNGFVGSAVVKKAIARGWQVTSLSRSGKPFVSPQGHSPSWTEKVDWRQGSPFDVASYETILPKCFAVVSTLGVLFESDYKTQGRASPLGVLRGIASGLVGDRGNPLAKKGVVGSYETMNRDSAIAALDAFITSRHASTQEHSTFVYISAEDIFRPFVPARYISTKREAERSILERLRNQNTSTERTIKPVLIRPSLIYHPHLNPATTLPATLLEATSRIHAMASGLGDRAPSDTLPMTDHGLPPAYASLASLMRIPPIHVDAVGEAVCKTIEDDTISGVVDVARMRRLLNFDS